MPEGIRETVNRMSNRSMGRASRAAFVLSIASTFALAAMVGCSATSESPLTDPSAHGADLPAIEPLATPAQNFEEAGNAFTAAIDATTESAQMAHLRRALAFCRWGLELDPTNARMHKIYQVGLRELAHHEPGFEPRMLAEYRRWYEAHDRATLFAFLYARALFLVGGDSNLATAQGVLAAALADRPNDYTLNLAMGRVCVIRGKLDTAIQYLSRATAAGVRVGEFEAPTLLGEVFAQRGRLLEAETMFRLVIENDPVANVDVYEQLAKLLVQRGEFDIAKHVLLYELPPELAAATNCRHLRTVGDIYREMQDWRRAAEFYRRYLEFNPTATDRETILRKLAAVRDHLAN